MITDSKLDSLLVQLAITIQKSNALSLTIARAAGVNLEEEVLDASELATNSFSDLLKELEEIVGR